MNNPLLNQYYNQIDVNVEVCSYTFYDVYEVSMGSGKTSDLCGFCILGACIFGMVYGMCNG